jgi:hypothetical protein
VNAVCNALRKGLFPWNLNLRTGKGCKCVQSAVLYTQLFEAGCVCPAMLWLGGKLSLLLISCSSAVQLPVNCGPSWHLLLGNSSSSHMETHDLEACRHQTAWPSSKPRCLCCTSPPDATHSDTTVSFSSVVGHQVVHVAGGHGALDEVHLRIPLKIQYSLLLKNACWFGRHLHIGSKLEISFR